VTVERKHLGAFSGNAVIEWVPIAVSMHVTILGHQVKRRAFWGGPIFLTLSNVFNLCPTHFPGGGAENIYRGFRPPLCSLLVTGLAVSHVALSFILCERKYEWICSKVSTIWKIRVGMRLNWTLVQFMYGECSSWKNQLRQARFYWKGVWLQGSILKFWGQKQTLRKGPQHMAKCVLFHLFGIWC